MGWVNEMQELLGQYRGAGPSTAAASAPQDYDRLAQSAPSSVMATALASTIRSPNTPAFGDFVAQLFGSSNSTQRTGILQHLQQAAGSTATTAGGGAADQASSMKPEAVRALAEQAERRDPSIVDRASAFYAQHPTLVKGLGATILATLMHHVASQNRPT